MANSQPPLHGNSISDELCLQAAEALKETAGNKASAARLLGVPASTFNSRLQRYHSRNLDGRYADGVVAPGSVIREEKSQVDAKGKVTARSVRTQKEVGGDFEMPEKWAIEKSTVQLDGNGDLLQQWIRIKEGAQEAFSILDALKETATTLAMAGEARPRQIPETTYEDCATLRPLPDLHIGMYAWGEETGHDWDLKTAITSIKKAMVKIDDFTPPSSQGLILGGGDLIHADNKNNQTERNRNALDVDTRFSKVTAEAMSLLVFQIELSRAKHQETIVRILPGNHDEYFSHAAAWYLHAWYRNADDVIIDTDPGDFWFYRWGDVMLGANHGHKVKLTELPRIMSTYKREMWGQTKLAYAHGFHIHHRNQYAWEEGGVMMETHQAPGPQDAFHRGGGYLSGRSMCSITYSKSKGEQGRWTEPVF